ncbi:MAG: hypothetical protein KAI24_19020, partial [Planctomycetes bacterium]|nr:hypothetical protein [Planctomycetota bacterium]
MTDVPAPPPAPRSPRAATSPAQRPATQTLLTRLSVAVRQQSWFAVGLELVIVVLGVLIAFQVTSWGQEWGDRRKEQTYLRQLAADLAETEQTTELIHADVTVWDEAAARLLRAWRTPERPRMEEVMRLLGMTLRTSRVRTVDGTAQALIATGDLALIRDDALRSAITANSSEDGHQVRAMDLQLEIMGDAV